jgi:hypothetical protein
MIRSMARFFKRLEIFEDVHSSGKHKKVIEKAVFSFLKYNNEDTAYGVYEAFFTAYWIGIQHSTNPFLELPKILKRFEEHAGCLIDKHRDHFVHSVNVFVLGLSIYANNEKYEQFFNDYALNENKYPDHYRTKHEEFFYRWGLTSLFHDIAYPLEITLKQANTYFNFVWDYPQKIRAAKRAFIEFPDFNRFISLPLLRPGKKQQSEFYKKYPLFRPVDMSSAIDLLAQSISCSLGIQRKAVLDAIKAYVSQMRGMGVIDHGFYGAIIMLRWYHHLLKTTQWNPAYFYYPILDSASAILMHNFFKNVLMRKPLNAPILSPAKHPIAFLLILCDELQDWNRRAYGKSDAPATLTKLIDLSFTPDLLRLVFTRASKRKEVLFKNGTLRHREIFPKGIISITKK